MKNLAGNAQCDSDLVRELLTAGIKIVPIERGNSEVPFSFVGELNGWRFSRAWYYWVAHPVQPNRGLDIEKARKLYATNGKEARAGGDCACRAPETWSSFYQVSSGKKVVLDPKGEQLAGFKQFKLSTDEYVFAATLEDVGNYQQVVDSYHIDTQEALNAFVEAIR